MSASLRAMAAETVRIIERGRYHPPGGGEVHLADPIGRAVAGTRLYLPEDLIATVPADAGQPTIEVTRETTLSAARRVGGNVAALVFASANNPGGGFLHGAQAQEESLARASALYASQLAAADFYAFHRRQSDLRYTDRVIYSPDVPVFRDDDGALLPQPFLVSFLTAAAPNMRAIAQSQPDAQDSVSEVLRARARRVLQVAAAHQHRQLVLGAWGCGVFANEPSVVAGAFAGALAESRCFEQIVFAVFDPRPGEPTYRAFASVFA